MGWPKKAGSRCAACGQRTMAVVSDPIEQTVGGRSFLIGGFLYNRCTSCGEEFLSAGQVDELMRAANVAARHELKRLSGENVAAIRRRLGLTQKQLAMRLSVSPGLVARWERETVMPSAMADRYLRDLSAHPELVDRGELIARESRGPYRPRTRS